MRRKETYQDLMTLLAVGNWEDTLRGSYPPHIKSSSLFYQQQQHKQSPTSVLPPKINNLEKRLRSIVLL